MVKRNSILNKLVRKQLFLFISLAFLLAVSGMAQESSTDDKDLRPVRSTFESIWIIDNQTVMVPYKGTFEMDILHRFGVLTNGYDDFFGLFAPSNFRLGFNYVPIDKLQIGFGFSRQNKYWDFNAKYAIVKQARKGGFPLSLTYYVNAAIDSRDKENFIESVDRFSYFHQLMVARKINDALSLQTTLSLSHFNFVPPVIIDDGTPELMKGNHLALSVSGKYSFSGSMGFIANLDFPITDHEKDNTVIVNPEPNISFGVEMVTSSHAFQIFIGNYMGLVPQENNARNNIDDFLIGFNITRLWNF